MLCSHWVNRPCYLKIEHRAARSGSVFLLLVSWGGQFCPQPAFSRLWPPERRLRPRLAALQDQTDPLPNVTPAATHITKNTIQTQADPLFSINNQKPRQPNGPEAGSQAINGARMLHAMLHPPSGADPLVCAGPPGPAGAENGTIPPPCSYPL